MNAEAKHLFPFLPLEQPEETRMFTDDLSVRTLAELRKLACGHIPEKKLDSFIEQVAECIIARGIHESIFPQRKAATKEEKRKLSALVKAIENLEGTQAIQELSSEFRDRFLCGHGITSYRFDGGETEQPTGENVLRIVKEIAGKLADRPGRRDKSKAPNRKTFFVILADAWTQAAGGPPPESEGTAFDGLYMRSWYEATGEHPNTASTWIREYRNTIV